MTQADQHNDLVLLKEIAEGDQQAFTMLYKRHHQGIYNFLLSIVKIPETAEDLLQDVFLKIWEDAKQLNVATSFSAYLYQAARNKAIDALRRIARDPLLVDEVRHRLSSGIYQLTYQEQEWKQYEQLFNKALEALPPQRRQAFRLVRQAGKKYDEAAHLMGISRNTLKQHLSLAVESIRKTLLDEGDIILALMTAILFGVLI
ncbi:hypothetical protein A8C56_12450 [Niabella ginsenosidivorans]|uniref:RNA polymerase sigma-70 factor n=1 Tax=Niabella ginsenosidivorans TaxID=1176587 RepID=A0A1A9I239_9BACT|nr:sigma-70 family RNA polymerase sigma factor [Niabella ginsenosidivorans]ANH81686.1 hypothetical protein A8C56_12450 [Niabella ginsenosidivorans]